MKYSESIKKELDRCVKQLENARHAKDYVKTDRLLREVMTLRNAYNQQISLENKRES